MARFTAGLRSTGAGSTTLPVFSLYASASVAPRIREIGMFNTTSTALAVCLRRYTTAGTSSALTTTGAPYNLAGSAIAATPRDTHSSTAPTVTAGYLRVATIGAAAGAGIIWTFGDTGLIVPAGTANGIGVAVYTGTGQILDWYIDWEA